MSLPTATAKTSLILIVEDEPSTNRMIQLVLERGGFNTCSVFDIAGAMQAIQNQRPDLILLDISLPDGCGFDVCQELQKETGMARIPVLFISSHEDVATKILGFEVGGVDYITKPIAGAEIIARVSTHLRLQRAYDKLAELQAERIQRLAGAQEALMPNPEEIPQAGFSIHLRQILQAGGDFYDVVPISDQVVDYIVADASGHDLAASFWTASLKTLIAQNAYASNTPRDIVHAIDNTLRRILPEGVFFTLIYARLNRNKNTLTLVNAAHPPAIIIPVDGRTPYPIHQQGDIVGMFDDAIFDSQDLKLQTGDRLLLYSDGLIELEESHETGLMKLLHTIAQLKSLSSPELIEQTVDQLTQGLRVDDDIVLMGVEI